MSGWLTPERRWSLRMTLIIVVADLLFNAGGVIAFNLLRANAMHNSTEQRATLDRKMDAAWGQRIALERRLERACRR